MKLTESYHGGSRKMRRNIRNNKMVRKTNRRHRGGGSFFTPYSDYPSGVDYSLPKDMADLAKVSTLDAKFAELPAVQRAAGVPMQNGGRYRGGQSPVDAPSMILSTPEEEAAARLNPQWYTENTVVTNFRGPLPIPGGTVPAPAPPKSGGRRLKSRKNNIRKNNSRKYKMMRR